MSTPENRFLKKIDTEEKRENRFLGEFKSPTPKGITFEERQEDVGVIGAFGTGVKEGFLAPLTLFGREGEEVALNKSSERVANVVGEFVGLGLGFVPFSAGTGVVLKGIGLTSRVSPPVAQFLQFTLAGTAQAVGTAEGVEEIPKAAAIGFTAGVAIDGFFLARALRGRADDLIVSGSKVDTGSPLPDEVISKEIIEKELEIAPVVGKSRERLASELNELADSEKTYDQILVDLTESYAETVRIPGLEDTKAVKAYVNERFPNAQVLERATIGSKVKELLIHNPTDGTKLTPKQVAQWKAGETFDGMVVYYRGNPHVATGIPVAEGRVQLKSITSPAVFAPLRQDVTIPITPRVRTEGSRLAGRMRNAVQANNEIGFTIASREGVQRGVVDAAEYEQATSLREFLEANRSEILQIQSSSLNESISIFARQRGIKGLMEVEEGITKRVHVFDQETVSVSPENNLVGVDLDQGDFVFDPTGNVIVHSFVPSWRNSIVGPLRRQGFKEKDINNFLDTFRVNEARRLQESLMDDEFKAILRQSESQFFEGCV